MDIVSELTLYISVLMVAAAAIEDIEKLNVKANAHIAFLFMCIPVLYSFYSNTFIYSLYTIKFLVVFVKGFKKIKNIFGLCTVITIW